MIAGVPQAGEREVRGQAAERHRDGMGKPWPETIVELAAQRRDAICRRSISRCPKTTCAMQIAKPWVVIGTDAGGYDPDSTKSVVHPRSYGSYPRMLGQLRARAEAAHARGRRAEDERRASRRGSACATAGCCAKACSPTSWCSTTKRSSTSRRRRSRTRSVVAWSRCSSTAFRSCATADTPVRRRARRCAGSSRRVAGPAFARRVARQEIITRPAAERWMATASRDIGASRTGVLSLIKATWSDFSRDECGTRGRARILHDLRAHAAPHPADHSRRIGLEPGRGADGDRDAVRRDDRAIRRPADSRDDRPQPRYRGWRHRRHRRQRGRADPRRHRGLHRPSGRAQPCVERQAGPEAGRREAVHRQATDLGRHGARPRLHPRRVARAHRRHLGRGRCGRRRAPRRGDGGGELRRLLRGARRAVRRDLQGAPRREGVVGGRAGRRVR